MLKSMTNWHEMALRGRMTLVAGVIIILAMTAAASFWLLQGDYQVLFADLEPRDAASVVSELERMKVDYELAGDGTLIKVAESSVHAVRLKLMGSGVPLVGGVGFEIFDDADFGMTDFAQRINYQRALEGELTRTVMSLKEVKYARLHLVMPERGLFQKDDTSSSASVTLFLHAEQRPSNGQILGIQRLIAAAVPGLKAWQVTVTDQDGVTLSRQLPEQDGVAAVAGRLEQKQAVERYLCEKVDEVLKRTFGLRQALVSIDAVLDFSQVKRTHERILSADGQRENGVVRRRETKASNATDPKGSQNNLTTDVEYRLGRAVEQIVETPGNIVRLSVGVMAPAETSEERLAEIRELVKMSVGFDGTRGDAMAVYAMGKSDGGAPIAEAALSQGPLRPAKEEKGAVSTAKREFEELIARYPLGAGALMSAAVLGLLAVGLLLLRRGGAATASTAMTKEERERLLGDIRLWLDSAEEQAKDRVEQ